MKYLVLISLGILLGMALGLGSCSLFQPAAPVVPVTPPVNVAQVVQKTIACIQQSVTPCLSQPPPMNNAQFCMAIAAAACAQVN